MNLKPYFFPGLNWSEDQCLSTSPSPMSLLCQMHTFDFSRNELLLWFPVSQAGASEMWVSGGTWSLRNYSLFSGWCSWTWRGGGGQGAGESELISLRVGRNTQQFHTGLMASTAMLFWGNFLWSPFVLRCLLSTPRSRETRYREDWSIPDWA